jgi:hypothetical protein
LFIWEILNAIKPVDKLNLRANVQGSAGSRPVLAPSDHGNIGEWPALSCKNGTVSFIIEQWCNAFQAILIHFFEYRTKIRLDAYSLCISMAEVACCTTFAS